MGADARETTADPLMGQSEKYRAERDSIIDRCITRHDDGTYQVRMGASRITGIASYEEAFADARKLAGLAPLP